MEILVCVLFLHMRLQCEYIHQTHLQINTTNSYSTILKAIHYLFDTLKASIINDSKNVH